MIGRLLWGSSRARPTEARASASIPGPTELGGGRDGYGLPSDERALRHSAVWSAVALRAGLMGTFPAHSYRDVDGRRERQTTPPILRIPRPGPTGERVSMGEFAAMGETSLMLRGNFYALIGRDVAMRPVSLQPLHPDAVTVRVDGRRVSYWLDAGRTEIDPVDVWHRRRHVMPGSPVGLSAISYARTSIQLGLMAEEFGADFFRDGAHPSGLVKSKDKLTKGEADNAKERWMATVARSREPVVLGGDWDYHQIQVSPEDSQFLDAIGANVATIARFMSVPPELIGGAPTGGSSITYANLADRLLHLLVFHLQPAIESWEDGLTEVLPGGPARGAYCKLATDSSMRLDPKTQAEVNRIRLANGETNPDELRALRDLPPIPGGIGQVFAWPPVFAQLNDPTPAPAK